ncbi:MAG: YafY family transcriptional regulator [Kineosporiaceae bacterium]|nr:YafY family transcriptional regulator [Aeromicrobium sp.]
MSRTTGRTLALLGLLQAHREWSGTELQARLDVSPRTLRRDIDDLRALGYGIDSVPGVGGGYRLGLGAAIPPLVLSPDEAVAIAVGLRAAASATVTGIEDAAARALVKLEQSLSSETRERISAVERAIVPLGRGGGGDVDLDTVVTIARAIRESRALRIDYRRHDGAEVRRTIEPHRIVHTGARWYVIARDPDRDAWRTFRLDRLTPRLPLAEPFVAKEIPDDAVRDFTTRSITSAPYRHQYRVRMHAPATEVEAHFGPTIADVTPVDDRTCELTAGSASPEEFALYIGMTGLEFEVLEGDDLRVKLLEIGARFRCAGAE